LIITTSITVRSLGAVAQPGKGAADAIAQRLRRLRARRAALSLFPAEESKVYVINTKCQRLSPARLCTILRPRAILLSSLPTGADKDIGSLGECSKSFLGFSMR
jgi:hypothetical protein